LNHLRDVMFDKLRKYEERARDDRKRAYCGHKGRR
jgi:hypothetical protein